MSDLAIQVRKFILDELQPKLTMLGISRGAVSTKFNLIDSGILDSMSFIELIGAVENKFSVEMDFENLEANEITSIEGFIQCAVESRKS